MRDVAISHRVERPPFRPSRSEPALSVAATATAAVGALDPVVTIPSRIWRVISFHRAWSSQASRSASTR